MATWDITVPAGSGVGEGGSGSSAITEPGNFDGATITDVSVVGTPSLTSDGATDDTISVYWYVTTDVPANVYGGASSTQGICSGTLGDSVSSDTIADDTASPAPGTAVAADWDEIRYGVAYTSNKMGDAETCSWSSFTIRVTYTPSAITGSGSPSLPLLTASGTGERIVDGTGAPSLPLLTAAGTGAVNPADVSGSGAPSLPLLTASGTGERIVDGTGAPSLPLLTASGAGERIIDGTGAANLPLLTAAGASERIVDGSGDVTLPLITASGAGERIVSGTGAPNLPLLTASGSGSVGGQISGSGTPTLPLLTAAGAGTVTGVGGATNKRVRGMMSFGRMMS